MRGRGDEHVERRKVGTEKEEATRRDTLRMCSMGLEVDATDGEQDATWVDMALARVWCASGSLSMSEQGCRQRYMAPVSGQPSSETQW